MPRAQLILYAVPTGLLGEQCDRFFRMARAVAPTAAQTYPPHCSLTGFFHRPVHRVAESTDALALTFDRSGLDPAGRVEACEVQLLGLRRHDGWLGLELASERLSAVAAAFALACAPRRQPGDDALRLKDWLHLSLAYDTDGDTLDRHGALAHAVVDDGLQCDWEIGLWRRHPVDRWQRLAPSAFATPRRC
ncbi:MAG: hypothetical protein IT196_09705 [Acidimicrobiales bacterium]|nr:hypothetical protein [Acidimicrobiales bacterium]